MMLFALEGESVINSPGEPSCEQSCPIADRIEETFGVSILPPETQLVRHLNNHMREALIESGMFEMLAQFTPESAVSLTAEQQAKMLEANERLRQWSCRIKLDEADKKVLREAVAGLPRLAWVEQPLTLWRLRRKLKAR